MDDEITHSLETLVKGAGFFFIGVFFSKFINYIYRMILARYLGPADYGLISLGLVVVSIAVSFSCFGLTVGLARFIPYYYSKGDKESTKGVIITALKIILSLSLIVTTVVIIFSRQIAVGVFHDPTFIPILIIFAFSIPFISLADAFTRAKIGFKNMKFVVYTRNIFESTSKLLLTIILLYLGLGVIGVSYAYLLAAILTSILGFYYLEFKIFSFIRSPIKSKPHFHELLDYSWPLLFQSAIGKILGNIDILMLGYYLNTFSVGIYNVALPTAALLSTFYLSINVLTVPVFTTLFSKDKIKDLRTVYNTVTRWAFICTVPILFFIILFARPLLALLFGSQYELGTATLIILSFGYFISSVVGPTDPTLKSIGKTKIMLWNTIIVGILNIVLNIYLIPIYGIVGAAIATAISKILWSLITLVEIYYYLGIQPYSSKFLKPSIASILSLAMIYGIEKSFRSGFSNWTVIPFFVVYISIYIILLFFMRSFYEEDVEVMRFLERRSGIRIGWLRNTIKKFL